MKVVFEALLPVKKVMVKAIIYQADGIYALALWDSVKAIPYGKGKVLGSCTALALAKELMAVKSNWRREAIIWATLGYKSNDHAKRLAGTYCHPGTSLAFA